MDKDTKAVLTVIAVALVVIAVRMSVAPAAAQFGPGCGAVSAVPCFVTSPPGSTYGCATGRCR
jgi:hypothetical protein